MQFTEKIRERIGDKNAREGDVTRKIEELTSALPSSTWLIAAGVSVAGSLIFKLMGRDRTANFIGQWAPTLLIMGLYNKVVKVAGSGRRHNGA